MNMLVIICAVMLIICILLSIYVYYSIKFIKSEINKLYKNDNILKDSIISSIESTSKLHDNIMILYGYMDAEYDDTYENKDNMDNIIIN